MEVKGANPFLFGDDDPVSYGTPVSNPFLLEDDEYNPFPTSSEPAQVSSQVTHQNNNPFAFDPEELENSDSVGFGSSNDQFMTQATITINTIPVTSSNSGLFDNFEDNSKELDLMNDIPMSMPNNQIPQFNIPQKPTDLDLSSHTSNIPPSKETQDLFMSVMGAMDATSSHLLDKIPPTRTPSPVSMRDLHSPSPTPEPMGDLLDVGEDITPKVEQNDFFNTQTQLISDVQEVKKPPRPAPPRPVPPQRPAPPSKPPPPVAKPAVPLSPFNNQVTAQNPTTNLMDDFCLFDSKPSKPATKADILNLYNANNQTSQVKDLLLDDPEPADTFGMPTSGFGISQPMTTELIEDLSSTFVNQENKKNSITEEAPLPIRKPSIPSPQANIETVDNSSNDFLTSPNVSQQDFHMDTSDSQSKESVNSVTFNPFAAVESNEDIQESKTVENIATEPAAQTNNEVMERNDFNQIPKEEDNILNFNIQSENSSGFNDTFQDTFTKSVQEDPVPILTPLSQPEEVDNAMSSWNQTHEPDEFDAFASKFDAVSKSHSSTDPFGGVVSGGGGGGAWGDETAVNVGDQSGGFGEDNWDANFLPTPETTVPFSTPRVSKQPSRDSDDGRDFNVFIRPKTDDTFTGAMPTIAPPPTNITPAFSDTSPRINPFDQSEIGGVFGDQVKPSLPLELSEPKLEKTSSQESPPTPLYDEDVSQPLEPFPRSTITGADGWEMQLRQPNKKKITGQRFWKKIFVKLSHQTDCILLQLFNQNTDKDPFQELPLQPCYSVSDIGAQQYDQFGKIFTVKLQYIFYKERPGVRPGQVKKAERITNKLSQFAAYAIQGDYQGVKEFGSDLKKLGLPVEHAPQVSQLLKIGSLSYEDLKQFSCAIEEALFRLQAHRDRALHYKMEEVQITAVDELYVEQDLEGHIERQIARVRLFFLGFLTGMPDIELGVNDMRRQGKEVVGRHDIIPVATEEWIRIEDVEFHACVQEEEWDKTHIIKFKPPDACYIELIRFRVRPPRNRELPLQLKASIIITGNKVELRADILVPGFASRKLGQIPCEDVQIRFPIPECWIYLFRVEKHFRYGSVKSAHRRTGKIKGIERILGTMETLQESLIEVTSGQAKYEHQHRAIVWRCPRLPKEGQGAYTTHNMVCKLALTGYDQMPDKLADYCYVEFTMPATQVSHTTCRSVSLQNSDSDEPPEKYVRYLARHEYRVGIEHIEGDNPNPYAIATKVAPVKEEKPPPVPEAESSSDSD